MTRERVVIDTNVLISGLPSTTSTPGQAIDRAVTTAQLLASTATLRELMTKVLSSELDPYVPWERRDALLLRLAPLIEIVEVVQRIWASRDPDDDKFLDVTASAERLAGRSSRMTQSALSSMASASASRSPSPKRRLNNPGGGIALGACILSQIGRTRIEGAISRATPEESGRT
jgi:uncharacterized protein